MKIKSVAQTLLSITTLFLLFPASANAHLIGGVGLTSGLTHPLLGLDHLLAMVAVGIISTQISKGAVWKVPGTFVFFMLIGSALAFAGMKLPFIETGIALSVLVLGVGIALSKKFPLSITMACVALFAIFHGHTHGSEMPTIALPALYGLGFVFSTTTLHLLGVFIGLNGQKTKFSLAMLRSSGLAISLMGIYFLLRA